MIDPWGDAPAGLLTLQVDGTVAAVNRTLLAWTGRTEDDLVGRVQISELFTVGGRLYWETHLSPLLAVEGRLDEIAVELRTPGERIPVLMTAVRTGELVRVVLVVARERARFDRELMAAHAAAERSSGRLGALLAVTAGLARAGGVSAVAQALRSSAREFLRASEVDLWLENSEGRLVPDPPTTGEVPPTSPGERRAVLRDGRVVVPVLGQSRLQAVLSLELPVNPGGEEPDLALLTTVGAQAGSSLDRARQNEERAGIALELQRSLLASPAPVDPRFDVAATYRPGVESLEVGGDWHDVFRSDGNSSISLTVGDVVGRGLRAAVAMGHLRSAVRALSGPGVRPAAVLSELDRFADQFEDARCATVALAHLDLERGSVRYACGGHLPPLHLSAGGVATLLWDGRSTPVGIPTDQAREDGTVQLSAGDSLLLYTDGLVERRRRPLDLGLDALVAAARRTHGLAPQVAVDRLVAELLADEDSRDDVCLLLVTWAGPAGAFQPS